jgi:hypothetical protein
MFFGRIVLIFQVLPMKIVYVLLCVNFLNDGCMGNAVGKTLLHVHLFN